MFIDNFSIDLGQNSLDKLDMIFFSKYSWNHFSTKLNFLKHVIYDFQVSMMYPVGYSPLLFLYVVLHITFLPSTPTSSMLCPPPPPTFSGGGCTSLISDWVRFLRTSH